MKMKVAARKMKRLLSFVLTVAMVATMLPQSFGGSLTVSAAELSDTEYVDVPDSTPADFDAGDSSGQMQEDSGQAEGEAPDDANAGGGNPGSGVAEEAPGDAKVEEEPDDSNAEEAPDVVDDAAQNAEDEAVQDDAEEDLPDDIEEDPSEEAADAMLYEAADEDEPSAAAEGDSSDPVSVREDYSAEGRRVLVIECNESADGNPDGSVILSAIYPYLFGAQGYFDIISINLKYTEDASISYNIIKMVKEILYDGGKIDYCFYDYEEECQYIWTLGKDFQFPDDINVHGLITAERANENENGQGIKLTAGNLIWQLPKENISLSIKKDEWLEGEGSAETEDNENKKLSESIFGGSNLPLKVFRLNGDGIIGVVEECEPGCGETEIYLNPSSLYAGEEYLLLSCEGDTDDETKQISFSYNTDIVLGDLPKAPAEAEWKCLDENVITIDRENGTAKAIDGGETYLYAKYTKDEATCYKVYKVSVKFSLDDYKGTVDDPENGERVLTISRFHFDDTEGSLLDTDHIVKAIEAHKEEEPFDRVLIELKYESEWNMPIEAAIFNAAADVLNPEYENRSIEYGFHNDDYVYNWIFVQPNGEMTECTSDRPVPSCYTYNGKIEISIEDSVKHIPAETISLYIERPEWRSEDDKKIREDIFGGRDKELIAFSSWNNRVAENSCIYCGEFGVTIDNLAGLEESSFWLMSCEKDAFMVLKDEDTRLFLPPGSDPYEVRTFNYGILTTPEWGSGFVGLHGNGFGETYLYIGYRLNDFDYYRLYKVKVFYGDDDYNGRNEDEEVEEGRWISKLILSDRDIFSGMLDTDKILRILRQRAEDSYWFNQIVIEVQTDKEQKQTVDKRIFNAANAILEGRYEGNFEYDGNLEYRFIDKEDGSYTSWTFGNPWSGTEEGTIDLTGAIAMERTAAGQGMQVRSNRSFDDIPAGWTEVYMESDKWRDSQGGMVLTDIFGGRNLSLKTFLLRDGDIIRAMDGGAYCGDYGVSVTVSGLSEGADYLILSCEGDTDNEGAEPISLVIGDKKALPNAPEGAEWKTLNRYAVTVSDTGEVTAVGGGTTYIIAKYKSGESDCFKAYKVSVSSADGKYIGRVEEDPESGERMLIISIFDVSELKLTKAQVLNALKEYQGEDKPRFDVVRFELLPAHLEDGKKGSDYEINKDVVNEAITVLNQGNKERRIEYNFSNTDNNWGNVFTLYAWTLVCPNTMSSTINARVTADFMDNGITLTLSETPAVFGKAAEWVGLNLIYSDGARLIRIFGAGSKTLDLFTGTFNTTKNTVKERVADSDGWYEGNFISINNVGALGSVKSFYVTVCEDLDPINVDDDSKSIGSLIPNTDFSSVQKWGVVGGTGKIIVKGSGNNATIKPEEPGYAYLYPATIKNNKYGGDPPPFNIYRIWVKPKAATSIRFASETEQIELGWDYEPTYTTLKVKFDSDQSVWDVSDSQKIKWATSDPSIVELVNIGGDPENPKYNGTVMAKKAGEATITVTYLKDTSLSAEDINNILQATCKVEVVDPIKIVDEEWPEVFAITNFDAKLGDVEIPGSSWMHQDKTTEPGEWAWKEPDTTLKQFQGQESFDFAAVYKVQDGRTAEYTLRLNLYTLTGISILGFDETEKPPRETAAPVSVVVGKEVALGYRLETDNWDWDSIVDYYREKRGEDVIQSYLSRIQTVWSIKPDASSESGGYASGDISYRYTGRFSGNKNKAEKKTLTVSINDTKTNAVILQGTHILTVTNHEPVNFDNVESWYDDDALHFRIDDEIYTNLTGKKLTFKSNDTSMLTLETSKFNPDGEKDGKWRHVSVPYKLKKNGIVYVTVTAADELKSSKIFRFDFPDREPKLDTYTVTVNKKQEDVSAVITVLTRKDTTLTKSGVGLSGEGSGLFAPTLISETVDTASGEYIAYSYKITAQNGGETLSKKKYSVTLKLPVSWEGGSDSDASADLTIKVVDKAPSVTFKQTKNVNTFYTSESSEGYGLLTVSAGDCVIETPTLSDCDFTLEPMEGDPTQYIIIRTDDPESTGKLDKKGVLRCKVEGYSRPIEKNITIKTASTKPKIALSSNSDTLYKKLEDTSSTVSLTNKATGESLDIQTVKVLDVQYVDDEDRVRRGNVDLDGVGSVAPAQNYFSISQGLSELSFELEGYIKNVKYEDKDEGEVWYEEETRYADETATFNFKVWGAGWSEPVALTYSIVVTNSLPSLKLGSSTLTLNKYSDIWAQQQASTTLRLSGSSRTLTDNFEFVPTADDENGLRVWYSPESGQVYAAFDTSWDKDEIKAGTYKYQTSMAVAVREDEEEGTIFKDISVTLSVKVVDTDPAQIIKVNSKGSIDVLDREGTSIVYTPKLGKLPGEIIGGSLEGTHALLFEKPEFVDGKLIVKASPGASFATKFGYKVKARFIVQTGASESDSYEVVSKELTIKVKQGKPKLKLSSYSNLLYRQFNNDIEIDFGALLKQKDVAISDVSLLNYTDDLMLCPNGTNEDGTACYYNKGTQSIRLSTQYGGKQILKFGKTWKVKFLVRYRDKAGNMKDAQVTYKIIVR